MSPLPSASQFILCSLCRCHPVIPLFFLIGTYKMSSAPILSETIAYPCQGDKARLSELTLVDWCVLDFANGKRKFKELAAILPTEQSALTASFRHLASLGFLTWETQMDEPRNLTCPGGLLRGALSQQNDAANELPGADPVARAMADLSDSECLQYLPQKLLVPFRTFSPRLSDETLDIDLGTQALIEFLSLHISELTPCEILNVEEGASKSEIRQAYLKRSRLFHPDRFFRKNIGIFSTHLSTLFKAVTRAFGALQ